MVVDEKNLIDQNSANSFQTFVQTTVCSFTSLALPYTMTAHQYQLLTIEMLGKADNYCVRGHIICLSSLQRYNCSVMRSQHDKLTSCIISTEFGLQLVRLSFS